jgi:hypothetical protein
MNIPITDTIILSISKLVDDSQVVSREPTHSEIEFQIKAAGLTTADPKYQGQTVGKAKRVRATLYWAMENDQESGSKLVDLLLSQIRAVGGFRSASTNYVGEEQIINAIHAFSSEGFSLSENGDIRPKVLDTLSGQQLTEALEAYANRAIKGSEDAALLSGTGKDLLEATAKHIIQTKYGSHSSNSNFPTLLGQAYVALDLATPEHPKIPGEPIIKDFERAIYHMAIAINKVRNKEGAGHGRLRVCGLSDDEGLSLIQSVGVVAEFLLNKLKNHR